MMELVICSGKGGTGKTSVVAAFAALAEDFVLADCDVDAPNLHLVSEPTLEHRASFTAGHVARIDPDLCVGCGDCRELCRFDAISGPDDPNRTAPFSVAPLRCEGCGVCVHFCPIGAISFPARTCGEWFISEAPHGPLVHATLDVGAENSGKMVTRVREEAFRLAGSLNVPWVLVDGPPGIGCPVTAALTGADLALLVTEPSMSGLHDLERIADLAAHFGVPALVCINKFDLSPLLTDRIEAFCRDRELPLIGRIPFEPKVNQAQAARCSLIDYAPRCEAAHVLKAMWHAIERRTAGTSLAKG